VKPRALALNAVVSDLEKLMRRTIGEQIELRSTYADDLWTIVADPGQLEQIVVNLAVNARDAMPHGGLLEIDTQNVVLDDEYARTQSDGPAPGKYVRITIADSGDGMPPDVLERAFEPFFTTKPQGEGTGLGLATVYGIVKQAGGNVFIYSEPGHGTSVKIHLPASDATVEQWVTAHAPVLAPSGGEAILVVEDEDVVRRLVERILAEKGYAVLAMPSAAKALAELSEGTRHFDLLLTDVVMPGMQGSELAHHAREIQPGLPVLLMSGYSEAIIERIDGRQGALDLVEKPFTRAQLLGAVSKSLSGAPQREVIS
jgi:CheY-like chemotaxis protein